MVFLYSGRKTSELKWKKDVPYHGPSNVPIKFAWDFPKKYDTSSLPLNNPYGEKTGQTKRESQQSLENIAREFNWKVNCEAMIPFIYSLWSVLQSFPYFFFDSIALNQWGRYFLPWLKISLYWTPSISSASLTLVTLNIFRCRLIISWDRFKLKRYRNSGAHALHLSALGKCSTVSYWLIVYCELFTGFRHFGSAVLT